MSVFVIAEVAQAHDGSLGTAHAFIDAAAGAGADAVKFQCHIATEESTLSEPWRVKFSRQDASRYDYWRRMEFTEEQWLGLKEHCDAAGVEFVCSPFSVAAVELLSRVGVRRWKVASGEVASPDVFAAIAATQLPLIVSTGMMGWEEIHQMVQRVQSLDLHLTLLQCTTAYPCPPERIGLNAMSEMAERFRVPVGLSDHSGSIFPPVVATYLGASVIEVHITWSRQAFGPDVPASLTIVEFDQMVNGVRVASSMRNNPVDKDALAEELAPTRALFGKSVVARHNLPTGEILTLNHLAAKKPGSGIPAAEMERVVGRRLTRAVPADTLLQESDFE